MDRTLVFIKPDGVKRGLIGKIVTRFEQRGLAVVNAKLVQMSEAMVETHYQEHVGKPFFPSLKTYIMSGPVFVMVLEGPGVVEIVRKMIGVTDAAQAEPGTIRGDYALTKGENIIHASDSPQSASREIQTFFG